MKAVWYDHAGAAVDVLTFGEMPTPLAGAGEVRVRLEASGVNPADTYRRAGNYRGPSFPRVIPNSDGAGVIDQVGSGVTRLKPGQRVWLFNGQRNGRAFGTAAEYIALAEQLVTPLPDNLSFADGAAAIQSKGEKGMTAEVVYFPHQKARVLDIANGLIEHSGEHYGQLVVYYRLAGLVSPESRPKT